MNTIYSKKIIFDKTIFRGKKIIITGATSGIGEDSSYFLNELGANLILLGRNTEKLNKLKENLGNKHEFINCDLSEEDCIFNIIKNLPDKFLPLDAAFHASGSELIKSMKITKTKDLYKLISNSAAVALSLGRAALNKNLFKENASLIFMSSVSSICGTEGMTAYASSKGCIDSMIKSMSIELATRNIRINSIVAGAIKTPMHSKILNKMSKESILNYEKKHPLGFGSCEDISNLVSFLISDASKWITGTSIIVDGGYSAI